MKKGFLLGLMVAGIVIIVYAYITGKVPKGAYTVTKESHVITGLADDMGNAIPPDTFNETTKKYDTAVAGSNKSEARVELIKDRRNIRVTCDLSTDAVRTQAQDSKKTVANASGSAEITFILPDNGQWSFQVHEHHNASAHWPNAAGEYTWKVKLIDAKVAAPLAEKTNGPDNSVTSPPNQIKNNMGSAYSYSQGVALKRGVRYTIKCEATAVASTVKQPRKEPDGYTYPVGDGRVRVSGSLVFVK
ncbi:MAG: hypothetical protein L0956_09430 [Candidatus Mariimomonas ferrooxydans]